MQKLESLQQKLIILDSESGTAFIYNVPDESVLNNDDFDGDMEMYIDSLGYNINSCQWMVALEVNDTTK